LANVVVLDQPYELHPQVALRPERFGALAYHYGNRRLTFLKHPDVVALVRSLADHPTLRDALVDCAIDETRWPSFTTALTTLHEGELIRGR
jgi:mycofactocin biosynthesis protein MftB